MKSGVDCFLWIYSFQNLRQVLSIIAIFETHIHIYLEMFTQLSITSELHRRNSQFFHLCKDYKGHYLTGWSQYIS